MILADFYNRVKETKDTTTEYDENLLMFNFIISIVKK